MLYMIDSEAVGIHDRYSSKIERKFMRLGRAFTSDVDHEVHTRARCAMFVRVRSQSVSD